MTRTLHLTIPKFGLLALSLWGRAWGSDDPLPAPEQMTNAVPILSFVQSSPGPDSVQPANASSPPSTAVLREPAASYFSAAEKGSSDDACHVAFCYAQGDQGAPQSDTLALQWFQKAADMGDPQCEGQLGLIYMVGRFGQQIDLAKGFAWSMKAALGGNDVGQYSAFFCELNGQGCPANRSEAWKWLVSSACQGNGNAGLTMARFYATGDEKIGLPPNPPLAYLWSLLAENSGMLTPESI